MAKTKKAVDDMEREKNTYGYDKVFAHYDEKIAGSNKYEHRTVQKKPKPACLNRDEMVTVTKTSQQIGWRQPYDNLTFGHNRTGVCKRTFMDPGHL